MKLIVGLGNPGKQYQLNRHNIGFRCIDHIASVAEAKLRKSPCQSDTARIMVEGTEVLLAKPSTFVNLSGDAVACLLKKHKLPLSDLIVIYDDLDLPAGRIRIRTGGSAGGHRGIKSIIEKTGSPEFHRVRIGISRPPTVSHSANLDEVVDYVLGDFPAVEEDIVKQAIKAAADAAKCIITDGIHVAMNRFNRRR
jgi:PTH1 family peptidyl-tRNA hydrolase